MWGIASWACAATAQEPEPEPRAIELFEASRPLDVVAPTFPGGPSQTGDEGWVIVNFMIDEAGRPFEPMVVDAMGDSEFVDAALEALDASTFAPATLSGTPIVSSKTMRYVFVLDGAGNGARPDFVAKYRRFTRSVDADDQDGARTELDRLVDGGARSLYEDAFLNLAKFYYATRYGTPEEQMSHLGRALFFKRDGDFETYLPKEQTFALWPQLFVLQVRNKRFAEALATYEIIDAIGADEAAAPLADAVKQLRALASDDSAYSIPARTDENGSFGIRLFKDEFYLDGVESNIDEIKLRCAQRYVFFEFEAGTKYRVPPGFGQCELEVLGDAGTGFELVQT